MAAKKSTVGIFLLLAGVAGYFGLKKIQSISDATDLFNYDIGNFRLGDFTLTGFKAKFNLVIDNPTKQNIPFKSFVGDISFQGNDIATITTDLSIKPVIKPFSKSDIPMISVIPWSAAPGLLSLKLKKSLSAPLLVKGVITAGPFKKPIEKSFSVK